MALAVQRLRAAAVPSPQREARLLLAHALGVAPAEVATGHLPEPGVDALAAFDAALARREQREPLAYILGMREFWSLEFQVGPDVLIPRPESETLVEAALRRFSDRDAPLRVLDLGTGSGCLMLAFLSERPRATGVGTDLSAAALALAARNAQALGMEERCRFIQSDWAKNIDGRFDVIFVNPPYVVTDDLALLEPEVVRYEPGSALDGGHDGLECYRRVAESLRGRSTEPGLAFLELGQGQEEAVKSIFLGQGLRVLDIVPDLAGIARCLIAAPQVLIVEKSPVPKKELAIFGRTD